ncbi:MAG TPA: hypothetical protein VIL99_08985 [Ignavibacteria bacterium]
MADFYFNPFGTESIIVHFKCNKCSYHVDSEEINVPSPNYSADTVIDSQTDNDGYAICGNCEKEFEIYIFVTYAGASGVIEDLPDNTEIGVEEISEPYYDDQYEAISANTAFLQTFNQDLDNILELLKIKITDDNLLKLFHRQLYSSVIGIMETYLSDAFINSVFNSKDNLKQFFKTFKGFEKQNIAISAIYEYEAKAESIAKKAMLDVIYHHLPKVSEMYKDTFGIIFPKFGEIYKAVLIRHDLVHRNGKDKDGNEVIVDNNMIVKLIENERAFVKEIDDQIKD